MKRILIEIADNPGATIAMIIFMLIFAVSGQVTWGSYGLFACLAVPVIVLLTILVIYPCIDKAEKWAEKEKKSRL